MLVTHLKHLQLGLALVVNISDNIAVIKVYDIYLEDSLKLHVTISNLWDIEDQLYRLWIEVNGLLIIILFQYILFIIIKLKSKN